MTLWFIFACFAWHDGISFTDECFFRSRCLPADISIRSARRSRCPWRVKLLRRNALFFRGEPVLAKAGITTFLEIDRESIEKILDFGRGGKPLERPVFIPGEPEWL